MEIKIISSSKAGETVTRDEFEVFGGRIAGLSILNESYENMLSEDLAKTQRRIKQTKTSGIHEVYEHNAITLYLDRVPKILTLILKGEKQYVSLGKTCEDSEQDKSQLLYKKWVDIFRNKIDKNCKKDNVSITDARIMSLAKYYAGYLRGIFAPVSMVYSTNYRGLNCLIARLENFVNKETKTDLEAKCTSYMSELLAKLKELPYYDNELSKAKVNGKLNIFADEKPTEEYFGDVYSCTYDASFLELGEGLGYRDINYSISVKEGEYYVPEIIKDSESFTELWLSDIKEDRIIRCFLN